jgi:hypothetical protein
VDQQKIIEPGVVDAVARDFDLSDSTSSGAMTAPAPPSSNGNKFDLVDALRSLASLADRLRQDEKETAATERKL